MKPNHMSQALKNIRSRGVDIAIIVGGGDDADSEDVQVKELGLAPDAEPLEGDMEPGEMVEQPEMKSEIDLAKLLAEQPEGMGKLARRAMKKGE